jgi:hypothetical protein
MQAQPEPFDGLFPIVANLVAIVASLEPLQGLLCGVLSHAPLPLLGSLD